MNEKYLEFYLWKETCDRFHKLYPKYKIYNGLPWNIIGRIHEQVVQEYNTSKSVRHPNAEK